MNLLPYALHGLNGVRRFINLDTSPAADFTSHRTPGEKIAVLRRVAALLDEASEAVAAQGGAISPGIAPSASRFLDFVSALVQ